MTQPPLSAQIRQLEEEIGSQLLIRGSRHVQLTDAGQLFYNRARDIIEQTSIMRKELDDQKKGDSGTLRIGIVSSVSEIFLQQYALPFTRKFPDIRFELTESDTYHLLEMIDSRLLDLVIVRTPFTHKPEYDVLTLDKDHMIAVGRSESFAIPEGSIHLSDLTGFPLMTYRRWKTILDVYFAERGLSASYFCIADDARTILGWAREGLGVAVMPVSAYSDDDPALTASKIMDPVISSEISAVTLQGGYISAPMRNFLDSLKR